MQLTDVRDVERRIAATVDVLRHVPDVHRHFTADGDAAARFGLDARLLDGLRQAGLPAVAAEGGFLHDPEDLAAASLDLGLRSPVRDTARLWIRGLRRARRGTARHAVTVRASCPVPWHRGPCAYRVHRALRAEPCLVTDRRRGFAVARTGTGPGPGPVRLPEAAVPLLREWRDVRYRVLPTFLGRDAEFVRRTRVGDCAAVGRGLVEDARRLGHEARLSFGFLVCVPVSSPHVWAEIRLDGTWYPVDPLLPRAVRGWGVCGPEDWPEDLSPRGFYHRVTDDFVGLAYHGNLDCPVSLTTEVAE